MISLFQFKGVVTNFRNTEIAQLRHILSQAHHKPQKRYGEVCATMRDLCVFGFLLVFFSEVVIRERKLSNMSWKRALWPQIRCENTDFRVEISHDGIKKP